MKPKLEEIVEAYVTCRRHKRNTKAQLDFEANLESNLLGLFHDLESDAYEIGSSIVFISPESNNREVWAASFRDRVVQHIIYNRISEFWNKKFIIDSYACIPGRGTLFGAKRVETHIRKFTKNYTDVEDKFYLKLDLSNFFTSINKNVIWDYMEPTFKDEWTKEMTKKILFHDPTLNYINLSPMELHNKVEDRKKLIYSLPDHGLAVGNLTSQLFANILMDIFDKFVKHKLKIKHYGRYVDDMIFLANRSEIKEIEYKCIKKLNSIDLRVNPSKTIRQPISRGITFVGHHITKHGRRVPPKTQKKIMNRVSHNPEKINSYLGYLNQFTNTKKDHSRLLNIAMKKHYCSVDFSLEKAYLPGE